VGPLTLRLLEAVLARLMPWEPAAAGPRPGLRAESPAELARSLSRAVAALGSAAETELEAGLLALDGESGVRSRAGFLELDAAGQDALLADIEKGNTHATWIAAPHRWFERLLEKAAEARYANLQGEHSKAVWGDLGYPAFAALEVSVPAFPSEEPRGHYDVIVVGAGVAGSIVAGVLAEGGQRVLLLERGDDAYQRALGRDHLRNHRLSLYGNNTGPELEGSPRTFVELSGRVKVTQPHQAVYHNNAVGVGGGGLVFGGAAWRFRAEDFEMKSTYGTPAGSSLEDWPLRYEELAPYYERAEWGLGVAGDPSACLGAPQGYAYPMPAHVGHPGRQALRRGAAALGWQTHGVPLLINSVPHLGRAACVRCNSCVGFACPSDSKNGGHNTFLRRGIATGNLTLLTRAFVSELSTDARGRVTGVSFFRAASPASRSEGGLRADSTRAERVKADRVVVSCGAIESARLLLASRSTREPAGIGNDSDQVGRHLQGHVYVTACGLMPEPVEDGRGPGLSIATSQFAHGNPEIIGGGLLADDFVILPIIAWRDHLPPSVRRWGAPSARFMRDQYRHLLKITGPIQEIPSPENRVTLDPQQTDRFGRRVARLSGSLHPESARAAEFLRLRAEEWLRASGASEVWSRPLPRAPLLSAGQHQAGTCRMGASPANSVTDAWGRVHGHDNLYVIDASTHVTNGGVNPVLTIMALALRNAAGMLHGTA
jgi:choline dehydrogenase-like flavoprotein